MPDYAYQTKATYNEDELIDLFKKAHRQHHEYIDCLFSQAAEMILPAPSKDDASPNDLCHSESEIKKLSNQSSTKAIMEKGLSDYDRYSDHLGKLGGLSENYFKSKKKGDIDFRYYVGRHREYQSVIDEELQYSLVAFDRSLMSFDGMHQAYLVHLHLQCVQSNLQKYLKLLGKLRSIVEGLPWRIENASIH